MKVLILGAFGNLGQNTLLTLKDTFHEITCFDLPTPRNKKIARKLSKKIRFRTIWGNILDQQELSIAIEDQDILIHLIAIIPPLTDEKPDFAYTVNVEGTRNLVNLALRQKNPPKIVYSSSFSIYGSQSPTSPLITPNTPINPTDVYTRTKAEAEEIIKRSGLPWIVLRIAAALSLDFSDRKRLNLLYDIPLEQPMEFIHPFDVGKALANIIDTEISNEIVLLGGGKGCQLRNKEFLTKYLATLGIGMLPEEAFKKANDDGDWYYTNWLDTSKSQELLQYQNHDFGFFLKQLRKKLRLIRPFIVLLRPIIRLYLKKKSPYSKQSR